MCTYNFTTCIAHLFHVLLKGKETQKTTQTALKYVKIVTQ